ncbi:thioredoxin family protein [Salicibibacter cibarius]|uniref:Thioredoxin family protein n=1 Tax=Salicibibacter cibarius TaxID=2743000 RepID=A0A7T6Z2E6_9BACI|nr:thioredoxin family protein [Salicibibacter cibarius]QQK75456.1 thioredoxin family protein [Salicibibacter cibarius]
MTLNEWFAKGITPEAYIENMSQHKENLQHVYEQFNLPDDARLEVAGNSPRVIVLTEDWCGDAMVNVPILLHIAEKTNMDVSMLLRDSNLELMDQYLTNGKSRSIPIFIFIDEDGNEVATWGPRASEVQARVDALFSKLPAKDAPDYGEKWKETLSSLTQIFREDENVWDEVYESIMKTLMK